MPHVGGWVRRKSKDWCPADRRGLRVKLVSAERLAVPASSGYNEHCLYAEGEKVYLLADLRDNKHVRFTLHI